MDRVVRGTIHHIEIYVSDLAKSKEFWGWLLSTLGYEVDQEWKEGVSFRLGDHYVVFVQVVDRYQTPPYHRCRVGLNHLAFNVANRHEVDRLTQMLIERDVPILYEEKHPFAGGDSHYAVFFEDPDRIKVELVSAE